ncbi:MAG: hypothetical protein ACOYXW_03125 [Actinomycetota bacterium]
MGVLVGAAAVVVSGLAMVLWPVMLVWSARAALGQVPVAEAVALGAAAVATTWAASRLQERHAP